jgi:hypothetical protein
MDFEYVALTVTGRKDHTRVRITGGDFDPTAEISINRLPVILF